MVREDILQRFGLLAVRLGRTNYLFGDTFSVADPYLFILARGAQKLGFPLSACFRDYVGASRHAPLCGRRNGVKRFPRHLSRNHEASALKGRIQRQGAQQPLTERQASPAPFRSQAVQTRSLLACDSMTPSDCAN